MNLKLLLATFLIIPLLTIAQQTTEVYFDTASSALSTQTKETLSAIDKNAVITEIIGYCDASGSAALNEPLSLERAHAVSEFLKSSGFTFSPSVKIEGNGSLAGVVSEKKRKVVVRYERVKKDLATQLQSANTGKTIALQNLRFVPGEARMLPESEPVANELFRILKANPKLKIQIQGHICCRTPRPQDPEFLLSRQRAKAVYDFLVGKGIAADRLSYEGFGGSRPLHPIPEKSEREQQENRRVEIEVVGN